MGFAENENGLASCLANYYSLRGHLPPDSCLDLECSCGYQGVFDIFERRTTDHGGRMALNLTCPECGGEKPFTLDLRPSTRLRALLNTARRALRNLVKRRRKIWITAGVLGTLLVVAVHEYPPMQGWRILLEEGPSAALRWTKDPRTDREKIVQAWSLYSNGSHEQASRLVKDFFSRKRASKEKADALYLFALIDSRRGGEHALEYFHKAGDLYGILGARSSLFQVYVSSANHFASRSDPETAVDYLNLAEDLLPEISPGSANLAYFYETEAEVYFRAGMFLQALESSTLSLELYRDGRKIVDRNGVARSLSNTAFYQILLGDYQGALKNLVETERIILKLGNQRQFYYNKLSYYLLYKCLGFDAKPYREILGARALSDPLLKGYLDFVDQYNCRGSMQNKGDGTAPPPPPDRQ